MIYHKLSHILILHFQDGHGEEEELSVHVSPLLVIFFVFCMCSMLVLLYFFFNQLVYVIMFMFCTASTMAMYMCLVYQRPYSLLFNQSPPLQTTSNLSQMTMTQLIPGQWDGDWTC